MTRAFIQSAATLTLAAVLTACTTNTEHAPDSEQAVTNSDAAPNQPPPNIQAWMDRLTVDHTYDPKTGFIVAREVIGLPAIITSSPPAAEAVRIGAAESRPVVVFATADRCAPCQQYKKSALNDPTVINALSQPGILASHLEVDREPQLAQSLLGSRAIPMTYLFQNGERTAVLTGQRSAEELLAWLKEHAGS